MTWLTVLLWPAGGRGCGLDRQKVYYELFVSKLLCGIGLGVRAGMDAETETEAGRPKSLIFTSRYPIPFPAQSVVVPLPSPHTVPSLQYTNTPLPFILMATKAAYKRVRLLFLSLLPSIHTCISSRRSILPCRRSHPLSSGLHLRRKTF